MENFFNAFIATSKFGNLDDQTRPGEMNATKRFYAF